MALGQSPLGEDTRTGKRVTPWWAAYLLVLAFVFVFQVGGMVAFGILFGNLKGGSSTSQWVELCANLVATLAVFLWVWLYERRSIKTLGFRKPGKGVLKILLGVLIGAVMVSLPIVFLWAVGGYELVGGPSGATTGWSALWLVILLIVASIVQGGNEEVILRGFLTQNNAVKFPAWLAILAPALLFTILHGVLPYNRPLPFIVIMGYGVFAALVMFWQNGLWLIIGIHAGWNWALGNVYGIQVSGGDAHDTSLIHLAPAQGAPTWLTGGTFGTEGSLPAAVVIFAAAAVAFLLYRRASKAWPARPPKATVAADTEPSRVEEAR